MTGQYNDLTWNQPINFPHTDHRSAGMGINGCYLVRYRNMYFKPHHGSDGYPEWLGLKVVQGRQYEPSINLAKGILRTVSNILIIVQVHRCNSQK
jgi:hypothetical protein